MWRRVFLILLSEGHWCVCCEARCGKAIQEAALAAACEEHLLGCLRLPSCSGRGSLIVCVQALLGVLAKQQPATRSFATLLGYVREGKLSSLSFGHVCRTGQIRPRAPVGLGAEQEKKRKEEGQEQGKGGGGGKSNALVVFSHGNYLLFNSNMKSMHGWRFGTSNSIQGPLRVPLLSWSM